MMLTEWLTNIQFNQELFTEVIEYIGTFAFAISGIRLAAGKDFDLFGA